MVGLDVVFQCTGVALNHPGQNTDVYKAARKESMVKCGFAVSPVESENSWSEESSDGSENEEDSDD